MANNLVLLTDFQAILEQGSGYDIPHEDLRSEGDKLVLLFGATGSGSDSTIRELEATGRYQHLVSTTTRPPRDNNGTMEVNGREYWFVSEEEMLSALREKRMLEAEIIHEGRQVSGISLAELRRAKEVDKIPITKVEFNIKKIADARPHAIPIMVLPPSFEENLKRFLSRGKVPDEVMYDRMLTARKIYQAGVEWDIFKYVINTTLDEAARQVGEIVAGKVDPEAQARNKQLAKEILADVTAWINQHKPAN